MTDLTKPVVLETDRLGHTEIASNWLQSVLALPRGSMVSIEGPWGRGKTDIIARIVLAAQSDYKDQVAYVIALRPWKNGSSDLLTPLVRGLARSLDETKRIDDCSKELTSLLCAGASIAIRAAPLVLSGDPTKYVSTVAVELSKEISNNPHDAVNHVDETGKSFGKVLGKLLAKSPPGSCILICIDDLDRCLPSQQVAILESLHFLGESHPNAYVLVGIDPVLLKDAVSAHYGQDHFEPDRYLDKLFAQRFRIPQVSQESLTTLIESQLNRPLTHPTEPNARLYDALIKVLNPKNKTELRGAAMNAWSELELRNPRLVDRAFMRLCALSRCTTSLYDEAKYLDHYRLFWWIAVIDRFPIIRDLCAAYDHHIVLQVMFEKYCGYKIQYHYEQHAQAIKQRLPEPIDAPELRGLLHNGPISAKPNQAAPNYHDVDRRDATKLSELDQYLLDHAI